MQDQLSYTVSEWCRKRRISRSVFYELLKDPQRAPRTYLIGSRRYVSKDADREWLERMERLTVESASESIPLRPTQAVLRKQLKSPARPRASRHEFENRPRGASQEGGGQ